MNDWEKVRKSMGCRPGEIRGQLGISIEEFAKIMGVSVGVMCRWIGNVESPDINEQIRMNELLTIKEEPLNLRATREELELTAEELGEALDIPESDILAYERASGEGVFSRYKLELYRLLESARKREKLMKKVNDE